MAGEGLLERFSDAGAMLAGRKVLVALSGGPDSAVAAWLAQSHAETVRAVFVDHQWEHSSLMQAAAREVADKVGIPFAVVEVDCLTGPSPENQARIARYEALENARLPDESIITGHNSNDQAETVLFHVARGSGSRGMSGIPAGRGAIIRPLLSVSRADIDWAASALGLPAIADPANESNAYARNRVRAVLREVIEAVGVEDHRGLVRSGELARRDEELLEDEARTVPLRTDAYSVTVSMAHLHVLSPALRSRVFRRMVAHFRPYGAYFDEVERLEILLAEGSPTELSGGLTAIATPVALTIHESVPAWIAVEWNSGEVQIHNEWTLSKRVSSDRPAALPIGAASAVFDADSLASALRIVPAAEAETISMKAGTKRVRDCLSEGAVAHHLRDIWPVVMAGTTVIWIPGIRRSAVGWISEGTKRYLSLHVVQEDKWRIQRF